MGNHFSKSYNLANRLNAYRIPVIPRFIIWMNRLVFSCDIPLNPNVDETANFAHNGLGTVLHQKTKIGKNTKLMQHVTIGGNMGKKKEIDGVLMSCPVIGDNVFIGTGATIMGPVKIGNNAKIGAGAVVFIDVPENGIAVGVPAKLIN